MTNKEKFKEVFEKTFGYIPEDCFPCPEKCPEEYIDDSCDACPYSRIARKEYKQPEPEAKKEHSESYLKISKIAVDLGKILSEYSPVPIEEVIGYVCIFMDTLTGDDLDINSDLLTKRTDLAEKIFKEWPHSAEYYKRQRKEEKEE